MNSKVATALAVLALAVSGCSGDERDPVLSGGNATASGGDGATGVSADGGSADGSGTGSGSADGGGDDGTKYDVGDGNTGPGDNEDGCEKIDFLFVLDNSISMGDEQQNLSSSFPDFITTIQNEVVSDYHVMVVDTDSQDKFDEDLDECHGSKCAGEPPDETCGVISPQSMWTCGNLPPIDSCDPVLGAGVSHDGSDQRGDCGLGGKRWFDDTQANPGAAFQCVANLHAGNSPELGMDAMLEATSPALNAAGACNDGFMRDDAVLVVTVITDEEDDGDSTGNPASWKADLLARKNGNQTAVVVLGLVGDTGLPGAVCPPDSVPGSNGGEYSPRLIEFVESFGARGVFGSVCEMNYGSFFSQAVAVVEQACDDYVPEG